MNLMKMKIEKQLKDQSLKVKKRSNKSIACLNKTKNDSNSSRANNINLKDNIERETF